MYNKLFESVVLYRYGYIAMAFDCLPDVDVSHKHSWSWNVTYVASGLIDLYVICNVLKYSAIYTCLEMAMLLGNEFYIATIGNIHLSPQFLAYSSWLMPQCVIKYDWLPFEVNVKIVFLLKLKFITLCM